MLCQICQKREATRQVEVNIDFKKTKKYYFCDECIEKHGQNSPISTLFPGAAIPLLREILREIVPQKPKRNLDDRCPNCGTSLRQINEKMKPGCGECYRYFRKGLTEIVKACQRGAIRHLGKKPGQRKIESPTVKLEEKHKLEEELNEAVRKEEFEKAAGIRDKIKKIDEELAGSQVKATG